MKKTRLQRGFKARAERLARRVRAELGLALHQPFDPRRLAHHLDVAILELEELVQHGANRESVTHFRTEGRSEMSAVTVFRGSRRVIIVNEAHARVRQASSLTHELAHLLLKHPPHSALADNGCRLAFAALEDEADYLASVLLVPSAGATTAVREGLSLAQAAARYEVSEQMMRWRLNDSGALKFREQPRAAGYSVSGRAQLSTKVS